MLKLLQRPSRTLLTPSCAFKLYGEELPSSIGGVLRGIALTWIGDTTAGFVRAEQDGRSLAVYWWEGRTLRRLRCDPSTPSRRPDLDPLTVASVDELPVLAFEAARWNHHVLEGRPPAISSYLAEFHP